jgi:uncharacterized protein YdhG (YjbR/CyaY superfamily)
MADTKKSSAATSRGGEGDKLSPEELAAMKETIKERKAQKKGSDGEQDVLAKIAEMPKSDRDMAERIHKLVRTNWPELTTKTWYGMPAYYKDGKLICFFQSADKFKARYATFGFEANANLDAGTMWPTSWALTKMTAADEAQIKDLIEKAVS